MMYIMVMVVTVGLIISDEVTIQLISRKRRNTSVVFCVLVSRVVYMKFWDFDGDWKGIL